MSVVVQLFHTISNNKAAYGDLIYKLSKENLSRRPAPFEEWQGILLDRVLHILILRDILH